ncbi:DUF3277 family protein [Paramixta manurensis]|uniref:DUF3277 family protein n=1 Tax=Paramixta manurensis TaxID=2740817 RepID=A0A6M8UAX2_9GAMM|nr:DUF3277 family protein [Erwiniaceae bacterium PD-1]
MAANYSLSGTFDGSEVHVIIGTVPLSGFSDGDSITATRSGDLFTKRSGLDGSTGRSKNTDKSGTIEVRLLSTSAANDALSLLMNMDSLGLEGDAVFPISVVDMSGRTVISGSECWLQTPPSVAFSTNAVGERAWVFAAASLQLYVGGNN